MGFNFFSCSSSDLNLARFVFRLTRYAQSKWRKKKLNISFQKNERLPKK